MSELLNWYIEDLRQQLAAKVSPEKLDNILREAESHLLESARNRLSGLADERVAMEDAINAYGLPKKVALTYLRRMGNRVLGMPPVAASLLGCFVVIYCWNFMFATLGGYFDNFGDSWQNVLAGVVGFFTLGLIIVAARKGYRSHRGAISLFTGAVALLCIPVMSFWMVGSTNDSQGISRLHLGRDTARVQEMVGKIEVSQAFLDKGMMIWKQAPAFPPVVVGGTPQDVKIGMAKSAIGKSTAESMLPAVYRDSTLAAGVLGEPRLYPAVHGTEQDSGGRFVVPREYGAFAMVRGDLDAFETVEKYDSAKKWWAECGPRISSDLNREHADMLGLLRLAEEARSGRMFFFNPRVYTEFVIGTLVLLPLLLLVDLVGAASAKPKRAWPKRRLA